jgi:two-component system, LytTR family, response regulator
MSAPSQGSSDRIEVMIVDDETFARKLLAGMLKDQPGIRVVAEAGTLEEARAYLAALTPDLILLDVELFSSNGFDLLPYVAPQTAVIFVTAHAEYAVRAFEENALHYLLKPVSPDRLSKALDKVRRKGGKPDEAVGSLLLGERGNWRRVPVTAVVAVQAEGAYSRVFTSDGSSCLMLRSLADWLHLLGGSGFAQLDRSLVVQSAAANSLRVRNRDSSFLQMAGMKQPIELGRVGTFRARRLLANGIQEQGHAPE